jgi:CO dehydrogenase/acetyl-CoA synthase gamma subunit (corrinoid Fe-S protein)
MKRILKEFCVVLVAACLVVGAAMPVMALPPRAERRAESEIKVVVWTSIVTYAVTRTVGYAFDNYILKPIDNYVVQPVIHETQHVLHNIMQ